jgi:hypothetical protein
MGYILERYGESSGVRDQIMWLWKKSVELESRLFAYLPFKPDQLKEAVERDAQHNYELSIDH